MSKPYILAVASWFPDTDAPFHGIFNFHIIKALSKIAHVKVLYVKAQNKRLAFKNHRQTHIDGIDVNYFYYERPIRFFTVLNPLFQWFAFKRTWKTALQHMIQNYGKPSGIQMHIAFPLIIGIKSFLKTHAIPVVLSENWSGYCAEDGNYKGLLKSYFTRYAVFRSAVVITSSHFLKTAMQQHGLKANYCVIPNPVNTQYFLPLQHKNTVPKKRFVHISSFTQREKNIKGLLNACAQLKNSGQDFELECIGNGTEWPVWKKYSETLQLQNHVKFSGYQDESYIIQALQQASALVMFSFFETFSVVILEALACGTPVICSAAGAIPEYFTNELGIMVPVNDTAALYKAMFNFEPERYHPSVLQNFVLEFCSVEQVSAQWKTLWMSLCPDVLIRP
jgi:glycosyltransferase involved in cell wall biosynthesis